MDAMSHSLEKLFQQIQYFLNLVQREQYRRIVQREQYHRSFKAGEISINRSQGHLLGVLLVHDGLTQKELSRQLQIRPASLGELVDKLAQNGYVERRVNENDKRVLNVYLTEAGHRVVDEVIQARQAMLDTIFSGLAEDEQQQLSALMGKLIEALEQNPGHDDSGEPEPVGERRQRMEPEESPDL